MDETEQPVCHITTTGRRSGLPRRTEIWYLDHADGLYVLSGNGENADWVRNLRADPRVTVELAPTPPDEVATVRACRADFGPFSDEQAIREAVDHRYHGWSPGQPLTDWVAAAVVVHLAPPPGAPAAVRPLAGVTLVDLDDTCVSRSSELHPVPARQRRFGAGQSLVRSEGVGSPFSNSRRRRIVPSCVGTRRTPAGVIDYRRCPTAHPLRPG